VRPLIATGDPKKSVDISRKAELYETSSGLVTITGGKLTTWRRMAKMTVDRIVEREFRDAPCRTHEIPLGHPVDPDMLAAVPGVDARAREHLAGRYGLFAERVLKICAEDASLAQPIVEGMPDLLVEAVVAARHEQARSVADVLLRRTRLGILAAPQLRDAASARAVAGALGDELGWSRRQVKQAAEAWPAAAAEAGVDPAGAAVRRAG
jgi:glycerol-3-phosphate dehydrogenase